MMDNKNVKFEQATIANGCFWCTEAIFEDIEGVIDVVSGYSGGEIDNPSYEEVCSGNTGHAECVQITFDPEKIKFEELLDIFWKTHDPTSLNRQGADIGSQYRSVIFYQNDEQKRIAEQSKNAVSKYYEKPIVTEIVPLKRFYKAEDYHQDYYKRNPNAAYCRFVIAPKIEKLKKSR